MADSNRFNSSSSNDDRLSDWVEVTNLLPTSNEREKDIDCMVDDRLHNAKSSQVVIELVSATPPIDVNSQLANGDSPLHSYVRMGSSEYPLLLAILSHCDPDRLDLDMHGEKLNTPLHLASELNNLNAANALIAFGADLNAINYYQQSPLDLARNNDHFEMLQQLFSLGAELGSGICQKFEQFVTLPKAPLGNEKEMEKEDETLDWKDLSLETNRSFGRSLSTEAEESYSAWLKWRKQRKAFKDKEQHAKWSNLPVFDKKKGERVLFLDGGGMRGLIQTEVLSNIATMTGRAIPELFDWIVGTSTGGIVALTLVYMPLIKESFSIAHLRKLFFEIKDEVFGKTRLGLGCDTEAMERILKREFGDQRMTPVPNGTKVLISAVDKSTDKLEVCWFNNCFADKYSGDIVWKVGRCTSAAPCYFKPMGQYIDGGLKVNNPSEDGMTLIQNQHSENLPRADLALAVSIGCGVFPSKKLGDFDIEKYLFFGKHWLTPWKACAEFMNLIRLLAEGINNSESAANNTRSRCKGQGIPFYRFSPSIEEEVPLSETSDEVLINMILKARADLSSKQSDMDLLIQSFYIK